MSAIFKATSVAGLVGLLAWVALRFREVDGLLRTEDDRVVDSWW